jgi:uncharacterized protein YabE (DUF348 family)
MLENIKRLISGFMKNKKNLAISISSFIAFSAVLGFISYEVTKRPVSLTIDGKQQVIRTHAETVANLLEDYHIKTRSQDYLRPAANTRIKDNLNIIFEKARPVEIAVSGGERHVWTTAKTVKDLLAAQHIQINKYDVVKPGLHAAIGKNMSISVNKAFQLTLSVGGKIQHVWSTSTTVADFLEQQKIKVNKLDRIEPSLDAKINEKSIVKVIRVEKVTDVVEEPVDYAVVTKRDGNLFRGKKRVVHPGEKGRIVRHYDVVLENGKEVSRKLISTVSVKDSIDRIVAIGVRAPQNQVSRGTDPVSSEFYVTATAFTAFCNGCTGHTATGINLRTNPDAKVIAVDPSVIPLGTKVYVDGYGYAVAGDTGSAINGYRIDVFFSTQSNAYHWGTKRVKIKILK